MPRVVLPAIMATVPMIAEISLLYTILHEDTPRVQRRLNELNRKVDSIQVRGEREVALHEITILGWVLGK